MPQQGLLSNSVAVGSCWPGKPCVGLQQCWAIPCNFIGDLYNRPVQKQPSPAIDVAHSFWPICVGIRPGRMAEHHVEARRPERLGHIGGWRRVGSVLAICEDRRRNGGRKRGEPMQIVGRMQLVLQTSMSLRTEPPSPLLASQPSPGLTFRVPISPSSPKP